MRGTLLLLAVASIAFSTNSQQVDVVGDFTRSPTEHIINEIDQPFVVRSVTGNMTLEPDRSDEPLADVLFEIEGFTVPEIADLLKVPLGTAASRLRRAREQFRTLVEACSQPAAPSPPRQP